MFHPDTGWRLHLVGRKDEAVASFKKAIALKADHIYPHTFLAAVHADLGQTDKAKAAAKEVLKLNPNFSSTRFIQNHTFHESERNTMFIDILMRAGLPE